MTKKESLLPSLSLWGKPAIRRFRSDLDDLFEDFLGGFFDDNRFSVSVFNDMQSKASFPKINVSETDDKYDVEIAVAGFDKDDVKLELKDNALTISADKKEENGEKDEDKRYLRQEISYRSFCRAVKFPCKVDADTADAEYKDGIINFKVNKEKEHNENCGVNVEIK